MLAEIALKDILLMLSKRNQEKRIYQKGKQKGILQNVEVMEEIQQLDNNSKSRKILSNICLKDIRNHTMQRMHLIVMMREGCLWY